MLVNTSKTAMSVIQLRWPLFKKASRDIKAAGWLPSVVQCVCLHLHSALSSVLCSLTLHIHFPRQALGSCDLWEINFPFPARECVCVGRLCGERKNSLFFPFQKGTRSRCPAEIQRRERRREIVRDEWLSQRRAMEESGGSSGFSAACQRQHLFSPTPPQNAEFQGACLLQFVLNVSLWHFSEALASRSEGRGDVGWCV